MPAPTPVRLCITDSCTVKNSQLSSTSQQGTYQAVLLLKKEISRHSFVALIVIDGMNNI